MLQDFLFILMPSLFFASFSQNEVEEFHKYIVIDAETKRERKKEKAIIIATIHKNKPPIGGLFLLQYTH